MDCEDTLLGETEVPHDMNEVGECGSRAGDVTANEDSARHNTSNLLSNNNLPTYLPTSLVSDLLPGPDMPFAFREKRCLLR